jgi:hypothetical protein
MKRPGLVSLLALSLSMVRVGIVDASTASASCLVPHNPTSPASFIEVEPHGHYTFQSWLAAEASQTAVDELGEYLNSSYGLAENGDPLSGLSQGLVGVAIDHVHQEYVVVADPAIADSAKLLANLQGIVKSSNADRMTVRVAPSCNSAWDLLEAGKVLSARTWGANAADTPIAWNLDAHDSTFHVTLSEEDSAAADTLAEKLGSLISIEWGTLALSSRLNDFSPHYSAAGIHAASENSNDCTSLVTVDLPGGGVGSVTAAHCFCAFRKRDHQRSRCEVGNLSLR